MRFVLSPALIARNLLWKFFSLVVVAFSIETRAEDERL